MINSTEESTPAPITHLSFYSDIYIYIYVTTRRLYQHVRPSDDTVTRGPTVTSRTAINTLRSRHNHKHIKIGIVGFFHLSRTYYS
jgi:hypothetical protein